MGDAHSTHFGRFLTGCTADSGAGSPLPALPRLFSTYSFSMLDANNNRHRYFLAVRLSPG